VGINPTFFAKTIIMYRTTVILRIYQLMRAFRLAVLTIGCLVGSPGLAFSQEQSEAVKPNSVVISIPTDDEFYFGKVKVAQADLVEKIKLALKDKPADEQIVFIKAGVSVKYGTVVSAVDAIRAAGFDRIGLVADKKKQPDAKPGRELTPRRPATPSSVSSGATLSAAAPVILIDVRSKTRLRLNSKPILLSQLSSRLEKLLARREFKAVFIKAPRKMSYGDVVKIIDVAKSAGAQPIGLQVDQLQ
jgi:biopolymer transport protein ExbD